jgi:hypothetical protein
VVRIIRWHKQEEEEEEEEEWEMKAEAAGCRTG